MRKPLALIVSLMLGCSGGASSAPEPIAADPEGAPRAAVDAGTPAVPAGPSTEDAGEPDAPVLSSKGDQNGSRLKALAWVGEDGARQTIAGVFRDVQLGTDCTFSFAVDGSRRCLPIAPFGYPAARLDDTLFADASCSVQAVVISKGSTPGKFFSSSRGIFTVTGALVGDHWRRNGNECKIGIPSDLSGDAYVLGAEVPFSSFVAGRVEVSP